MRVRLPQRALTPQRNQVQRRVNLGFEALEQLLMMSATPVEATYEQWRQQTFTVDGIDTDAISVDPQQYASIAAASSTARQIIGADRVASEFGYTGRGYTIAILDTGIDYNHSALAGHYIGGWDFVDNDADPMDLHGHGTHVAGIIGNASAQYAGIANEVNIVALRVLDANGSGSFANVELALQWVTQHQQELNIVSVNMSLGAGNFTTNPWTFLEDEFATLKSQGVFLAAATGNSFYSYGSQQGVGFPAISEYTVAVGATWSGSYGSVSWASGARDVTTDVDRIASFTQRGSNLDIVAPGAFITSTYRGGGYATLAGTSMASPVAAGAAVLIHQALDARGMAAGQDQIMAIMKATGVIVVDGDDEDDNVQNTGLTTQRIDVYSAITSLGPGGEAPGDKAPSSAPADPNQAFVDGLYQRLLARTPDGAGLNYWTNALRSGVPRDQLIVGVWNSPEHRVLQVVEYYQQALGRTASASELTSFVSALISGGPKTEWMRPFLTSAEFNAKHADNGAFVDGIYQVLLGRPAERAGKSDMLVALQNGARRDQCVDALLESNERYSFVIQGYYQEYLGRGANASEISYWTQVVRSGGLDPVAQKFLASQEFFVKSLTEGAQSLDASPARTEADEAALIPVRMFAPQLLTSEATDSAISAFGNSAKPEPSNDREAPHIDATAAGAALLQWSEDQQAAPVWLESLSDDEADAHRDDVDSSDVNECLYGDMDSDDLLSLS